MTQVTGTRHRIAIIGGGMSSMTAAFEITSQPGWDDLYDITLYQQGFRLGGKGASGRNRAHADRIEEHGLHIFMGFYENTFRVLRACYRELARPEGAPLRTWREAFTPHDLIVLFEQHAGRWKPWSLPFPRTAGTPGNGEELPPTWSYVPLILEAVLRTISAIENNDSSVARVLGRLVGSARDEIDAMVTEVMGDSVRGSMLLRLLRGTPDPPQRLLDRTPVRLALALLRGMRRSAEKMGMEDTSTLRRWAYDALLPVLEHFKREVWEEIGERANGDDQARRAWLLVDLMTTNVRGMIQDDLVFPPFPFESIDHLDYKEWLRRHGAHPDTVQSAPVNAIYDLVFARHAGIGAGSALRGALRMVLAYKGSIFYKMTAGMGDVVFAPLYEVLRRRGVKFRFFHRLDEVKLSEGKTQVAALQLGLQATVKDGREYSPLFDVKGLPCWPSEPLWEQLVEGERFQRARVDLENAFDRSHDVGKVELQVGRDFDSVILGVSIAALPHVAAEVLAHSPKLHAAVENIKTTATQAVQLWFRPDLQGLGWPGGSPVAGTYAKPFDTWADMSHLIERESFGEGEVGNIAYLCGHLPDPELPAGATDPNPFALKDARVNAADWLERHVEPLWPAATLPNHPTCLDYGQLVDPADQIGPGRLEAQYIRGNVNPSDRYVMSVPGSSAFRPRTDETNLTNLLVTGDWIQNGIQGGCAEAAVMAGLQTARAICGSPERIVGDTTPPPARVPISVRRKARGYIERGGDLVYRGPFAQNGTRLHSFVLPADPEKLAALCDRYLHIGETRYRPLGPFVILGCADIAEIRSLHPQDRNKGYMSEKDVAFWVPLVAGTEMAGVFVPSRVVWFLPYIFVDSPAPMVVGREIYGFPKLSGRIEFGEVEGRSSLATVDALAIDHHSPASRAKERRILEVRRKADDDRGALERLWDAVEGAVDGVTGGLLDAAQALAADAGVDALSNAFRDVSASRVVRMVFLKQFRDTGDPHRACYQAVVEANATVTAFRAGGPLAGPFEVRLARLDSHPIAEDLGLAGDSVEPLLASWLDFDFDVDNGEVVT